MVYCSVHGCSNERGKSQSKVDGRRFLRFFKLPKDARLAKDWKHRMRRRPEDITDKMVVCSDHFADDDFSNIIKIKNFYYEGMHIKLNPTAVPNTEIVKTGDIDCAVPTSSKRSRKRSRRDAASIDNFIQEQEDILHNSSIVSDSDIVQEILTDDMGSPSNNHGPETDQYLCIGTQTQCTCVCSCSVQLSVSSQRSRSKFASTQTDSR